MQWPLVPNQYYALAECLWWSNSSAMCVCLCMRVFLLQSMTPYSIWNIGLPCLKLGICCCIRFAFVPVYQHAFVSKYYGVNELTQRQMDTKWQYKHIWIYGIQYSLFLPLQFCWLLCTHCLRTHQCINRFVVQGYRDTEKDSDLV